MIFGPRSALCQEPSQDRLKSSDEISIAGLAGESAELAAHKVLETGVHGLKGEIGFSVYQTSDQTLTQGVNNYINWHAEEWDVGGYFDLTNERYTPLLAGKYFIVAGVQIRSVDPANDSDLISMLYKNGAMCKMIVRSIPGGSNPSHPLASGSCVVEMNGSTDYLNLVVMHYDAAARDTWGAQQRTFMMGFLIAQT